jgi:intracellular multiplication protein IcmK
MIAIPLFAAETSSQQASPPTSQALQQLQLLVASETNKNAALKTTTTTTTTHQPAGTMPSAENNSNSTVIMPSAYGNVEANSSPATTTTTTQTISSNVPVLATSSSQGSPQSTTDPAFELVTSRLFPLSTAQVVKLHAMYNSAELAQVTSPRTPPRPTATSQFVNLSTGSTPPVIRLAQGFVSSLVFLDSTGAPWPIVSYDLGDPRSFNIAWDRSGNTLMIQSNKLYTYGNLAVKLQGLNTPVMLTLIPGQKAVDYRMDLRVQGYGPNALPTQTQSLPPSANSILLNVLDGVPPPGSKLLDVTGGPAEAWEQGDRLYLRTRLKVLSPGWLSVMSSGDGMNAYEMSQTPVLLVSWRGKVLQLRVEGL